MNNTAIQTDNLVKTIPQAGRELQILRGVSLTIDSGESVAITGLSGSGKSTLLGLLAGLDLPTSGSVKLFGQALDGLDEDQRAALRLGRVGFVFQSFHLLENLTALENVMLPLELGTQTITPYLPRKPCNKSDCRNAWGIFPTSFPAVNNSALPLHGHLSPAHKSCLQTSRLAISTVPLAMKSSNCCLPCKKNCRLRWYW